MGEAAIYLTPKEMRWGAFWVHPEPRRGLLSQVLSPVGKEMVVGGLTHPLVPNAQCRAMVGRSRKCSRGRWRQQ